MRVSVHAPAKINLTLRITGRRADGYHLLQSLFAFTRWGDDLVIDPADQLTLTISGPTSAGLSTTEDNLVLRAARLLQAKAGIKAGAAIQLEKRIPVAAGLGGGSADAAATLRGLNALWGLNWPFEKLEAVALELGADIPACVRSQSVIAEGIGDVMHPASALPELHIVLVNPGVATPTPAVFKAFREQKSQAFKPATAIPQQLPTLQATATWLKSIGNDLEGPAQTITPAITEVLSHLRQTNGVNYAALSGSGATCFALCSDAKSAAQIVSTIQREQPNWLSVSTMLLG